MKIALVSCPHAVGWCYADVGANVGLGGLLGRLPCPCNAPSTVLAEFDALDLIRRLSPDGSVERGMQHDPDAATAQEEPDE